MEVSMVIKEGKYQCQCGKQFNWKTFFMSKGEAAFFNWELIQYNVKDKLELSNSYRITLLCPYCNKINHIEVE